MTSAIVERIHPGPWHDRRLQGVMCLLRERPLTLGGSDAKGSSSCRPDVECPDSRNLGTP